MRGHVPQCPIGNDATGCGGAYLAWRPPIYASFTALSLLVQQAAVKCGLPSKAIWLSRLSSLRQHRAVSFQLLVQQPGTDSLQIRGTSQTVPALSFTSFWRPFFSAWPGS